MTNHLFIIILCGGLSDELLPAVKEIRPAWWVAQAFVSDREEETKGINMQFKVCTMWLKFDVYFDNNIVQVINRH